MLRGRCGLEALVFVKVQTNTGLVGYGECSDGKNPWGVAGVIQDLRPLLVGQDPRPYEMRFWEMILGSRQSPGAIAAKGIAGIELALLDVKTKDLGISVVELFGGPMRERLRLYWSHCGTSRAEHNQYLQAPPLRSMEDISLLGREVVERGFTALKTNIFPGELSSVHMRGFGTGPGVTDHGRDPSWSSRFRTGSYPDPGS